MSGFAGASPFFRWFRGRPWPEDVTHQVMLPVSEIPFTDFSGPTDMNRKTIKFTQGAVIEGPQIGTIYGTQGWPNGFPHFNQFNLQALDLGPDLSNSEQA